MASPEPSENPASTAASPLTSSVPPSGQAGGNAPSGGEDANEKPISDAEVLRNLLVVWTHQNGLIWGRLQTMAVVNAAVLGGWYSTFAKAQPDYAAALLVAALGVFLSTVLLMLIHCDLARRNETRDEIEALEQRHRVAVLPKGKSGIPGRILIMAIAIVFLTICAALVLWTAFSMRGACCCKDS